MDNKISTEITPDSSTTGHNVHFRPITPPNIGRLERPVLSDAILAEDILDLVRRRAEKIMVCKFNVEVVMGW